MGSVRVVTDSAADIPAEMATRLGITVVPLSIHFGERTYIDGEDLDAAQFYSMLGSDPNFPRTSQPSVGRFEQVYALLRDEGAEILSVHISSRLSGTFNAASLAARSVEGATIRLVDSGTVSIGQGHMAITAARLAAEGLPLEEIVRQLEALSGKIHISIMLDNLTHLQRGGRIGRAASLLGTLLNVKPIVAVGDGVVPRQRVRTTGRAVQELAREAASLAPLAQLYVGHSEAPQLVEDLSKLLQPLTPGQEVPVLLIGPVVGTHVGTGGVGFVAVQQ